MNKYLASRVTRYFGLAFVAVLAAGCASYVTPGAGVNVNNLSKAPEDIGESMSREPAASFPSPIAMVRAQSPGYRAYGSAPCVGRGRYCIITSRDVEREEDFTRISGLPMIAGLAPVNRLLLPEQLETVKDLRLVAAQLKTDILFLYSLDTRFDIEDKPVGPFGVITLGFIQNKKALVSTTASAVLFDVRTGFIYGVAETTATDQKRASMWSTEAAIDDARRATEAASFQKLVNEFEKLWKGVVETHLQANKTS